MNLHLCRRDQSCRIHALQMKRSSAEAKRFMPLDCGIILKIFILTRLSLLTAVTQRRRAESRVVENRSLGKAFCEREKQSTNRHRARTGTEHEQAQSGCPVSPGNLFCVRRTPLLASGFQPLVRSFARAACQGCVTSVIDIETGEYEVDDDALTASKRALAKYPGAAIYGLRVGSRFIYEIGGSRGQAKQ